MQPVVCYCVWKVRANDQNLTASCQQATSNKVYTAVQGLEDFWFLFKINLPSILPTSHNSCLFLCFKMSCVQNSHMIVFMALILYCLQWLFLTKITLGTLNTHVNTFV